MVVIKKFHLQDLFIKTLLYWDSGTWKTSLAATAPDPFWLSAEGWLASVLDTNPIGIEIKSLKDLKDAYDYLKAKQFEKDGIPVKTVIIDSATEINEIAKDEIKARKGWRDMEWKDWGKVQDEIKWMLRKFRDLPLNVIFICLAKEDKDEDKVTKIVPMLNGQAARDIVGYMDIVAYTSIDKTWTFQVTAKWDQKLSTKDRLKKLPTNLEFNFSTWLSHIKDMKTQENETICEYDCEIKENKEWKMITKEQWSEILNLWDKIWELSMDLYPFEVNDKKVLKYTTERCEPVRIATMKNLVGTSMFADLTKEKGNILIEKFSEKVLVLENEKNVNELKSDSSIKETLDEKNEEDIEDVKGKKDEKKDEKKKEKKK